MPKVLTRREYKKRRIKYQVAAGLLDFAVTIGAFFAIVFCVYLLFSLYGWVMADIPVTFRVFFEIVDKALTMH